MKIIIKLKMAVVMLAMIVSCGSPKEKNKPTTVAAVKVEVMEAVLSSSGDKFQYSGTVVSDNKAVLSTKLLGQVKNILVDEGDEVSKGQLLVEIKSEDIKSKLASVNAGLKEGMAVQTNTQKNYDRINNLYEKGSATQRELDDISTKLTMANAKVESIEQNITELQELLTYANLRSPINGFVSQKFLNTGDMASPGLPILALESMTQLKVDINVPEFEIEMFETGDLVSINFNSLGEKAFNGKVNKVVPSMAFSGAQFKVSILLEDADSSIKPGMFGKVSILRYSSDKIRIPKKAIYQRGQLQGVFVVSAENQALLRWLRLGSQNEAGYEVLSGLDAGEQIISFSEAKLVDGQKVQITKLLK